MEFNHSTFGLPWWASIVLTTFALRTLISPLIVRAHKNTLRMKELQPQLQEFKTSISIAKASGDSALFNSEVAKLMAFYRKEKIGAFKSLAGALVTAPIFMSFFLALRDMTAVGVPSMKTGGVLWFQDLSLPDPFVALPIMAMAFFMVNVEV